MVAGGVVAGGGVAKGKGEVLGSWRTGVGES